jgi:chemotaxis protein methyltransferase CheR
MSTLAGDDYLEFCHGLRKLCGVDLTQYKRAQMERRLRTYFARDGFTRLTESLQGLRADPAALEAVLDRITINVSQLWRNPEQWQLLEHQIVPDLAPSGRLRAWSAGSSYGAEAYTLAAVCKAAIPDAQVRITGTDIDRRMVARAKLGKFSDDDARSAPKQELERWFERSGGGWQARPELRQITHFEVGDLLRVQPRADSFDLILCRNTVIYFAEPIRDELHARLAHALRPGGCLVIGSTERVAKPTALGLRPIHPFTYTKA